MKDESISDIAVDAVSQVCRLGEDTHKYNDFGSMLGVREEVDAIREDLERALRRSRARIARLKQRIRKYEAGDHEVGTL